MAKFKCNDMVVINELGVEGRIIGSRWNYENGIKINHIYNVSYKGLRSENHMCANGSSATEYLPKYTTCYNLRESEISAVEEPDEISLNNFGECSELIRNMTEQIYKSFGVSPKLLFPSTVTGLDRIFDVPLTSKTPICECGMEKHGFANHSNWCGKAEK
jgi:hypothetical protein